MKCYIHCFNVGGVLVPVHWQHESEHFVTPDNPLPSKVADMVTGLIEIDKADRVAFYSIYTGKNVDGDTSGDIEIPYYFHTDAQGTIIAYEPAYNVGILKDVPAKKSFFITAPISAKNGDRKGAVKIAGERRDGAAGKVE